MSETRQRTRFVGIRLTPAEYAELAQAATQREISIPAFIREVLAIDRTATAARGMAKAREVLDAIDARRGAR